MLIVAPCSSAISRTIARPRPLPSSPVPSTPVEAHEDPLLLGDRNTYALIAHAQHDKLGPCRIALGEDGDLSVAPAVLDRVVDQVGEQLAQQDRIAFDERVLIDLGAEIDALAHRARHELGGDVQRESAQIDAFKGRRSAASRLRLGPARATD